MTFYSQSTPSGPPGGESVLRRDVCLILTNTDSLWFLFAWDFFFQLFTFNFYISLALKCVSCGQPIFGSFFFLIQSDNLCLFDGIL